MATKYVGPTGSNANPGTFASPFLTINYGLTQVSPGDTLRIKAGTYDERILSSSFTNGTDWTVGSGAMYLTANPGDTVTIRPSGGSGTCLELIAKSYIVISDLIFDAIHDGSTGQGVVEFNGCNHIRFMDNEITNASWAGFLSSQSSGFSTYYEILRNTIHDGGRIGGAAAASHGMYFAASSGSATGLDAHHLIQDNFVYNFSALSNDSGIQIYGTYSVEADRLGGITVDGNTISSCGVGMYVANSATVPVTITNNVIRDNANGGIVLFHGLVGTKVYHNTIDGNGGWGIEVGNNYDATGILIKNNAITSNTDGPIKVSNAYASSAATITNNGLNGNGNANAVLDQNSLSTISGSVTSSPNYTNAGANNFTISGAPYVDAGVNVGVLTDRLGTVRPQGGGYDIGAYEFVVTGTPVPVVSHHYRQQGMA